MNKVNQKKSIVGIIILLMLMGCSSFADRKERTEDCVVRMVKSDIPPLKALEICKYVHPQPKDIIPKSHVEKEDEDLE